MIEDTLRIIHTADWHLGSSFSSFPQAKVRETLKNEQSQLLLRLRQVVKEKNVHLVLIAGDLFETPFPDEQLVKRVQDVFASMAPCRFLICAGNHDPILDDESFWLHGWPENVYVYPHTNLSRLYIPELAISVDSISFRDVYVPKPLFSIDEYVRLEKSPQNEKYQEVKILMLHGDFPSSHGNSDYNPIIERDIINKSYDYIALGHIHLPAEGYLQNTDTVWAYPGAPQGRGFDEIGERGFRFASIPRIPKHAKEHKHFFNWEILPSGLRPFLINKVNISDTQTETDLLTLVRESLERVEEEEFSDLKHAILRIYLEGISSLEYSIDTNFLEDSLRIDGYFYVECIDATRVAFDPERLQNVSKFTKFLVQTVQQRRLNMQGEEEKRLDKAVDRILIAQEKIANENK